MVNLLGLMPSKQAKDMPSAAATLDTPANHNVIWKTCCVLGTVLWASTSSLALVADLLILVLTGQLRRNL